MYTTEQRAQMLTLARTAMTEYVTNGTELPPPDDEYFKEPRGVFVTLSSGGDLRGCIGFPTAIHTLGEAIIKAAIYAATEDPRFPAVTVSELPHIELEISVLSPPRAITSVDEIVVGEHGLILSLGYSRGLLLPQVPVEHHWDRDTYLRNISWKAGLPAGAWKDPNARIEVFTAEVFGEKDSAA